MIAIYIFGVSMLVVFGIIGSRLFELKYKRAHLVSRLIAQADRVAEARRSLLTVKYTVAATKVKNFLTEKIPEQLAGLIGSISQKLGEVSDSLYGRRVLKNRGAVSFFLQRMSADKRNVTILDSEVSNK